MSRSSVVVVPEQPAERRTPHNLPLRATPLVGRAREIGQACRLLRREDVRLLSMVGPPGVGKTRTALEVAELLLEDFGGGVYFVPLAPVSDPELLVPTIARAVGMLDAGGRPSLQTLAEHLADRRLLLLLDNFEQWADGAPVVAELCSLCRRVKVLVTSRSALHLYGEQEFPVPPLRLPDLRKPVKLGELSRCEAVALFVRRAQSVKPGFQLNAANAQAVAEICVHLDGLPLAIELAASRIKLLSPPQALLSKLEHRLELLTRGPQNLPSRQQALRNAIEWSYDLLSAGEQRLFRRLAVFVGGFSLEAAEAVDPPGPDRGIAAQELQGDHSDAGAAGAGTEATLTLDRLESLVDKSLLRQEEQIESGESRFYMLETIREYAMQQLEFAGGVEEARLLHARYYLGLAEQADPQLQGPRQREWLNRLEVEHDNLRAAMACLLARHEAEMALRFGAALTRFWQVRGHLGEGRSRLGAALAAGNDGPAALQAKVLRGAGTLAYLQGDYEQARPLYQESLEASREAGDEAETVRALGNLANLAMIQGDLEQTSELYEQTLALCRRLGDKRNMALVLVNMAMLSSMQRNDTQAARLAEEGLGLFREVGDTRGTSLALVTLFGPLFVGGDYERARKVGEEGIEISRELGDKPLIARWLSGLGDIAQAKCDVELAVAYFQEGLEVCGEIGDKQRAAGLLTSLSLVAASEGDYKRSTLLWRQGLNAALELGGSVNIAGCLIGRAGVLLALGGEGSRQTSLRAVRLLAAVQALVESTGPGWDDTDQARYDAYVPVACEKLGEEMFGVTWAEGQGMTLGQAVSLARQPIPERALGAKPAVQTPLGARADGEETSGLTTRERETVALIAQGKSNRGIAEAMVVAKRTVETHIGNVMFKLGFESRAQIIAWAIRKGLAR